MREYFLLQLGNGHVGSVLTRQIADRSELLAHEGVSLKYVAVCTSQGGKGKASGVTASEIMNASNLDTFASAQDALKTLSAVQLRHTIVVDVSNADSTIPILTTVLEQGGSVVLANKRPLAGLMSVYTRLTSFGSHRLMYEATVGAGLPLIRTLNVLAETGDEILEISGCMSGTLGFICSSMETGNPFSACVKEAKENGYTETDPREDLSGVDVSRKALILARMIGQNIESGGFPVESLYTPEYATYSVEEFMNHVAGLDEQFKTRTEAARRSGHTLRYMATITKDSCSVGLTSVDVQSNPGALKGADNIFVIKTKRYFERPLVIQGPGAGPEVTAAGVFGDILTIAGIV